MRNNKNRDSWRDHVLPSITAVPVQVGLAVIWLTTQLQSNFLKEKLTMMTYVFIRFISNKADRHNGWHMSG